MTSFYSGHGMEWKTIFPYSTLAIFLYSILKIFHSILKFSSGFHSIFPYQGKCRPKATRNLNCTFATLSVSLQVVALEGKQHGTMHVPKCQKHFTAKNSEKILNAKKTKN